MTRQLRDGGCRLQPGILARRRPCAGDAPTGPDLGSQNRALLGTTPQATSAPFSRIDGIPSAHCMSLYCNIALIGGMRVEAIPSAAHWRQKHLVRHAAPAAETSPRLRASHHSVTNALFSVPIEYIFDLLRRTIWMAVSFGCSLCKTAHQRPATKQPGITCASRQIFLR